MRQLINQITNETIFIMKKKLFFAAVALVALASCTSDEMIGENNNSPNPNTSPEKPIEFNSGAYAITRGDFTGSDAAAKLGSNFVVEGVKGDGSVQAVVFDHYNVNWGSNTANTTTSNTNDWEYVAQTKHAHATISAQTIKYWDYATTQYDFIAYSKGTATAVYATGDYDADANVLYTKITPSTLSTSAYTVKGKAENLAKVYIADMVTAYRSTDYQNVVQLKFRSLSAKVRVALYETVPGYSVKDVVFYTDASTVATDGKAHLYTTSGDVFNEKGTYTVYYKTTGSTNTSKTDYNKAHLSFAPETSGTATVKAFGALDGTNTYVAKEGTETDSSDKLYIGRESNAATYAGVKADNYYTTVIPNEDGAVLNLKVNYKLISTDGSGEEIDVTGASAQVPAAYASWKSGYAYTYIFKISQNSNGVTNPSAGPAGLYPITFDAVVMDSEADGIQETITTVASPSITTYSKGKVVTENNEYKKSTNIYIVVGNGETLTVGTNAQMYKITLEDGAAQTINESSVENLLANGTNSGGTWTVTDANGKAMTASVVGITAITSIPADDAPDGNAITVNGVVFNTGIAGTYAFEYTDSSSKKYYKIIKIVN